jgi:zinc/manganese transport system substrate-binding protein
MGYLAARTRALPWTRRRGGLLLALSVLGVAIAGGLQSVNASTGKPSSHVIQVVAAENFWGSIASQLGGSHAHVTSIITNPNTDPHAYEPTTSDARTLASAQLVIENSIGYDPWVPKLLAADEGHQAVLSVGSVLGLAAGGNPHRWYNPGNVQTIVKTIVADYESLDPADTSYFAKQKEHFHDIALRQYEAAIAAIKAKYSGTPVGASESIFSMLAPALGLDLITPYSFLRAISEGTDISAADTATIDSQIKHHKIKIYVYNRQNVTPDVQAQLTMVKAERIPYATITETLTPATATYQTWQTKQLLGIEAALAKASKS